MPDSSTELRSLPVAVIGGGPVGLAAAAHLLERGLTPLVFEAGSSIGAAISEWGHIRVFSPWRFNIDAAAKRFLEPTGWEAPKASGLPTGAELVERYLAPLAATKEIAPHVQLATRVVAISRQGMDKTHSLGREGKPFVVRTLNANGESVEHLAQAVIDASGTWANSNPLGVAGLPAIGETEAAPYLVGALPDVLGRDRERHAGKHTLVVGAGHSATNTLINLAQLAREEPGTRITWAVRGKSVARTYGGGDADGLPARGALGTRLRELVEEGHIDLIRGFTITELKPGVDGVTVMAKTAAGDQAFAVDLIAAATGFRPDLDILRELRLDLDPGVEAPRELAPMIDPEFHSCGTVPPHGADVLAHPEKDFYIVGMKSYGRAPTFLMATGYEQVRSIAAELSGDHEGAQLISLDLPETGVCSSAPPEFDEDGEPVMADASDAECCGAPSEPVSVGFPTGLLHGRSGEKVLNSSHLEQQ